MLLPVGLILVAMLASGLVAYGTHPAWAQYPHGIEVILWSRRLQWPLVTLSLALCLVIVALVIAGRKRAWWLIGLAPVLALFLHRFATDPLNRFEVVENPAFVSAEQATLADDEWVVGVTFGDAAFAYPYAQLYATPVVIQADHEKRMMLMWSAYGNRAIALNVGREVKGRDFEVVSMPANALLLYDSRLGQFINGFTGRTMKGQKPAGFGAPIAAEKMTWGRWRVLNSETRVMATAAGPAVADGPRQPIVPSEPMPKSLSRSGTGEVRVLVVGTDRPLAIDASQVGSGPLNLVADEIPVLLFRDPSGHVRAFDRRLDDLRPRFDLNKDRKRAGALFVDRDTGTGWDAGGRAVDGKGAYKGRRLAHVAVEEGLSWDVLKFWYPGLELTRVAEGG